MTRERGHGRAEERRLWASTALNAYLTWPKVAQVVQLERRRVRITTGVVQTETVAGVTDLPPAAASAADLLAYVRGQWLIENWSHWVRDVTFGEDHAQVRVGSIPAVMATLRNTIIGLLRVSGETNIAAAGRRLAAQPWHALALLGCTINN